MSDDRPAEVDPSPRDARKLRHSRDALKHQSTGGELADDYRICEREPAEIYPAIDGADLAWQLPRTREPSRRRHRQPL
jgi:hypothetical protein